MTSTASAPSARTQAANRVVLGGSRVPSSTDREAIKRWAKHTYPKAIRSQFGDMKWGRGRQQTRRSSAFGWQYINHAGVRVVRGEVVVENYLGREIVRTPLATVAVHIVALMRPPEWGDWDVRDGVGLLVYADFLEERGERFWLLRIRRWAAEAMQATTGD